MIDKVKWGILGLLLCLWLLLQWSSVFDMTMTHKALGWAVLTLLSLGLLVTTSQGKAFKAFARESHIEIRKVFWPTRQETLQTTLIVLAMSFVMGLVLWGMDSIFLWLVGTITR